MSVIGSNILAGASSSQGYQISRSVRLRSSASAYFNRTMAAGGVTVYTFSTWVKRGELGTIKPIVQGYLNNNNYGHIIFKADNTIEWREVSVAANYGQVNTNAVFRDPSAWYHIVVVRNGTSLLIYVNGVSQTLTVSTGVNAAAGYLFGGSTVQRIGSDQVNSAFFDGYLTECYLIDGQALTPSSFGETNAVTGVWQPKKYAGTYGTNGFYLNFSDNSAATAAAIGKDYSGNGNNWTPNNISVTAGATYDSMLDVPTQWADGGNGRGNYATLNPLQKVSGYAPDNGNLRSVMNATGNIFATIGVTTGKWYWENIYEVAPNGEMQYGVALASVSTSSQPGNVSGSWSYSPFTGAVYSQSNTPIANVATAALNDVIGLALDVDAGTLAIYKNNSLLYTITSISGGTLFPVIGGSASINARTSVTFGQRPFAYTPPTGFKALNTLNLPEPTILKGNQYFDAVAYAGSASQQTITTSLVGLDFAWIKNRSAAQSHVLVDTVRGGSPLLTLYSNLTAAEDNSSPNFNPTSFTTNGIVLGGAKLGINNSGQNFVLWGWKEGAAAGFDIVTWTGTGAAQNISHNLGVAPAMIIWKYRSAASDWAVGHKMMNGGVNPWNYWLQLQSTAAQAASAGPFNNTAPTSTQFSVGTFNAVSTTIVAYLFAEVAGFSKFGSYTGNGSADGPFVFCGFRPRFIMVKRTDSTGNWFIWDTARDPYNTVIRELYPDSSSAEVTRTGSNDSLDIVSNGFKIRFSSVYADRNANGGTYIFAAFAESPFKVSLAR